MPADSRQTCGFAYLQSEVSAFTMSGFNLCQIVLLVPRTPGQFFTTYEKVDIEQLQTLIAALSAHILLSFGQRFFCSSTDTFVSISKAPYLSPEIGNCV